MGEAIMKRGQFTLDGDIWDWRADTCEDDKYSIYVEIQMPNGVWETADYASIGDDPEMVAMEYVQGLLDD
jgi:hypothetical protein